MTEFTIPECDFCDNTEDLKRVGNDIVCPTCLKNGLNSSKPAISVNEVIKQAREVNTAIETKADVFNAQTVSIVEIKKAIDSDETITNKPYALATELTAQFLKLRDVIFERTQQNVEDSNKQRAIQVYLNNMANTLRAEEREKLKISDINYQPKAVKMPVTNKTVRLSKKKIDTKTLRKRCAEEGVPEFVVRMMCVQKAIGLEDAIKIVKGNINAAMVQAAPPVVVAPLQSNTLETSDDEVVNMTLADLEESND